MKIISYFFVVLFFVFTLAILVNIFWHGRGVWDLNYWILTPQFLGRRGGISSIVFSTISLGILTTLFVYGVGIFTALGLCLLRLRFSKIYLLVETSLELLASAPSIIFGLVGHELFCKYFGLGYSILSGSLTLMFMILPLFISMILEPFYIAITRYQKNSISLQLSLATFFRKIIIPHCKIQLMTALSFSWVKASGETAALLWTSGYSLDWPESIFDSGRTLSVHIFELTMNTSGADRMAYQSTLALLLILTLGVFVIKKLFQRKILIY